MGERAKCVVCGEEQVDVEYLNSIKALGKTFDIGFPVCYQHALKDLAVDHYVFSDIIVEVT